MLESDDISYLRFTGPGRRDKAIHSLKGILEGMWFDGTFNSKEVNHLKEWYDEHRSFIKAAPFNEILPRLFKAFEDNQIDREEYEDIMWVVNNSQLNSEYYNEITTDIQELHGIIQGITSDGKIEKTELEGLKTWIYDREHLKGIYPYDEIESLILGVLRDGVIDDKEHAALLAFFNDFITYTLSKRVDNAIKVARGVAEQPQLLSGICSVDPEIVFDDRVFVFTGGSKKATRSEIAKLISERKGAVTDYVNSAHYLIVGNNGNTAWAFACYGRKVEKVMQLRKEGKKIVIVNEIDFWDAIGD